MGWFSKKETQQSCEDCGTNFRGIADSYCVCGSCLERREKNASPKEAKSIKSILEARAKYMLKKHT